MDATARKHRAVEASFRFKAFKKRMYDVWESFALVSFYMPLVHKALKQGDVPSFVLKVVPTNSSKRLSKNSTYGAISHLCDKANGRRTLMDAVATFEYYLGDVCTMVYSDWPDRLGSGDHPESPERQVRLFEMILQSASREEVIDRVVEERVRSIFYGNPIDFFRKDKAKLGFGDEIAKLYPASLQQLSEVMARRNILAHNDGRVDRKYLREIAKSSYSVDALPETTDEYLRTSIDLLIGFASLAAASLMGRVYGEPPKGEVLRVSERFATTRK